MRAIFWVLVALLAGSVLYELCQQPRVPSGTSDGSVGQSEADTRSGAHRAADEMTGRPALEAARAALRNSLAAGKAIDRAWEDTASAGPRGISDAVLSTGRTETIAGQAAKQAADQMRGQAPRARLVDPSTITVEILVSVNSANPPVISGSTNLPDGTQLTMFLTGERPACDSRCAWQYEISTVQGGRFTATPKRSNPLVPGFYTIDIATPMAGVQPEAVRRLIGENGERLRGPYVATVEDGKYAPASFLRGLAPSDGEKFVGLLIRYTEKIQVGGLPIPETSSATHREERWQRLEADNGLVFGVSLSSISRTNIGSATIAVCSVQNDRCQLGSMRQLLFDCRGQYKDITDFASSAKLVPPKSVIGSISKIACSNN